MVTTPQSSLYDLVFVYNGPESWKKIYVIKSCWPVNNLTNIKTFSQIFHYFCLKHKSTKLMRERTIKYASSTYKK